jgi:hypothetical protein
LEIGLEIGAAGTYLLTGGSAPAESLLCSVERTLRNRAETLDDGQRVGSALRDDANAVEAALSVGHFGHLGASSSVRATHASQAMCFMQENSTTSASRLSSSSRPIP